MASPCGDNLISMNPSFSKDDDVDKSKCIICQQTTTEKTLCTAIGRKRIREASVAQIDDVHKRLKIIGSDDFVYHGNNICYKSYILKAEYVLKKRASSIHCTDPSSGDAKISRSESASPPVVCQLTL